jgi:hypothetical protein
MMEVKLMGMGVTLNVILRKVGNALVEDQRLLTYALISVEMAVSFRILNAMMLI